MDTVLGLSLTPETAEVVAVDGRDAGGGVVYRTVVDTPAVGGAAAVEVAGQVVEIVLHAQAEAVESGRAVHALGVTWTDDATTTAALVVEKLSGAGMSNVVAVRFAQATEAVPDQPGQHAVGAAREATRNTAFPHVGVVETAPRPSAAARPTPQSLQYAGAAAMLVVGALTFVVSLSLAVSLQNTPEREVGPIERVATTTEPTVERPAAPRPEPTVAPVDVHEPEPAEQQDPAAAPEDAPAPEEAPEVAEEAPEVAEPVDPAEGPQAPEQPEAAADEPDEPAE